MASGDSVPQFQFLNTSNEFLTLCVSGTQVDITFSWLDQRYLSFQSAISSGSPKIEIQIISFNEWLSDIEQLSKHCEGVYGSLQALEDAI